MANTGVEQEPRMEALPLTSETSFAQRWLIDRAPFKRWEHKLPQEVDSAPWPLTGVHNGILIQSVLGLPTSRIAKDLGSDEDTILTFQCETASALLDSFISSTQTYFPKAKRILDLSGSKLWAIREYLQAVSKEDTLRAISLKPAAIEHTNSFTVGTLEGLYLTVLANHWIGYSSDSAPIEDIARITGYSESQFGLLCRDGSVPAVKVNNRWMTRLRLVQNYQSKRLAMGAPRRPRKKRPNTEPS